MALRESQEEAEAEVERLGTKMKDYDTETVALRIKVQFVLTVDQMGTNWY